MGTSSSSRTGTYNESVTKLKNELAGHAAKLKATKAWPELERIYRELNAIEDQAGAKRTTLEELLGVSPAQTAAAAQTTAKPLELAPEAQQETEAAAEIKKGA
jgi:hypothetical protein